jgi:hypothetical protein
MAQNTKYVELVRQENLASFPPPLNAVFDQVVDTADWKEIRVYVNIFVQNYGQNPVTAATKLNLRFMHVFGHQLGGGGQFDYMQRTISWNQVTSYINGYVTAPLIGDKLRILCIPESLPPGPYDVFVTYYLV